MKIIISLGLLAILCFPCPTLAAVNGITTNGLLSHWKLDENSGTAAADSLWTNTLTDVSNDVGWTSSGKISNSANFTIGGSRIRSAAEVPSMAITQTDSFSVVAWAYHSAFTNWKTAVTYANGNSGSDSIWRMCRNAGYMARTFLFELHGTEGPTNATYAYGPYKRAATNNTWYFVVGVHDAKNQALYCYVNNERGGISNAATAYPVNNGTADRILVGGNMAQTWTSRVDEVSFWKRVLTDDEVSWLYNSGSGRTLTEITNTPPTTWPSISYLQNPYALTEGTVSQLVSVALSHAYTNIVTVSFGTSNGTATAGSDYISTNGVFSFNPGEITKNFYVRVTDDADIEPGAAETVYLCLSNVPAATATLAETNTTISVTDNDRPEGMIISIR